MRIAIVAAEFPRLSETFVVGPAAELVRRGHDAHVFSIRKPSTGEGFGSEEAERLLDGRVHYAPEFSVSAASQVRAVVASETAQGWLPKPRWLRTAKLLLGEGRDFSIAAYLLASAMQRLGPFDAVHAHFLEMWLPAHYLLRMDPSSTHGVVTFHGHDVNRRKSSPKAARRLKRLARSSLQFVANTRFTRGQAASRGIPEDRIEIIPEPVNMHDIKFTPRTQPAEGPVRIVSIGRLVEKKGMSYLIRAMPKLLERHDCELHVLGGGPLESELRALIEELGLSERAVLHGWCDRAMVLSWLERAHLFVLASVTASDGDREGQGIVIQEAQAAGLPVVTTRHNGIPDGVLEGESAVLVEEGDTEALSEGILSVLDRPDRWPTMGETGSAFVRARYTTPQIVDQYLPLYGGA